MILDYWFIVGFILILLFGLVVLTYHCYKCIQSLTCSICKRQNEVTTRRRRVRSNGWSLFGCSSRANRRYSVIHRFHDRYIRVLRPSMSDVPIVRVEVEDEPPPSYTSLYPDNAGHLVAKIPESNANCQDEPSQSRVDETIVNGAIHI